MGPTGTDLSRIVSDANLLRMGAVVLRSVRHSQATGTELAGYESTIQN
jgi:hypothetical protein